MSSTEENSRRATLIEQVVQLAVLGVLVVGCFQIARPFLVPVLWGVIIAVALYPAFRRVAPAVGGRLGVAATLFTVVALAIVMVPMYFIADSLIETSVQLSHRLDEGTLPKIPPPPDRVHNWPVIGVSLHEVWALASQDTETAVAKYEKQLKGVASAVLKTISGVGGSVIQSIFSIIIAGIFLATSGGGERTAQSIGSRLGGEVGRRAVVNAGATISSVAKGVLGVALLQGLLAGIALFAAGVPAAGLWTVGVMVLAIVQLPPILLLAPICVWAFGNFESTTWAVVFAIYSLVVSGADSWLKPLFLGRGVEIPMPVILIGAIGGMMSMGIIGLFLGAVILSIGYSLFLAWLNPDGDAPSGAEKAAGAKTGA